MPKRPVLDLRTRRERYPTIELYCRKEDEELLRRFRLRLRLKISAAHPNGISLSGWIFAAIRAADQAAERAEAEERLKHPGGIKSGSGL